MGNIVLRNQPCIDQEECGSSDALQVYDDGTAFCFACREPFRNLNVGSMVPVERTPKKKERMKPSEVEGLPVTALRDRRISEAIARFFDVHVSYDSDGVVEKHFYKYSDASFKCRIVSPKDFFWVGDSSTKGLFGKDKFAPGGRKLVITEGEIDTMSFAETFLEKYGKIFPVVSIPSASQTSALLANRDWIRSFDEVLISFDNDDDAGERALRDAIKIIGIDKVKIIKFAEKDANDAYKAGGVQAILDGLFRAQPYVPSGIITNEELWKSLEEYNSKESLPYPACMDGLNEKLKGIRDGEITLFISGTGSGKSTMMREMILHLKSIMPEEEKIGVASFEEAPAETARKLSGMALMRNPADEEIPIEELKPGFDEVFGDERIMLLDHQGSMSDDSVIEKIEYMILMGCTKIIIDHITILVSEGVDNLTGNEAQDKIMNDLLRLVKRHNVWIGLVSHLRKVMSGSKPFEEGKLPSLDDIRGSGSVKQISFDVVSFARNMVAASEEERNTILMRVLKCRFTGLTGTVPGAVYDFATGRLQKATDAGVQFVQIDL